MIQCYEIQDAIDQLKSSLSDKCKTVNPNQVFYILELIDAIRRCIEEGGEGSENAVLYIPQDKSESERRIARENIKAVSREEMIQYIIENSDYLAEQLGYEVIINKQNNLTPDGTGTKYPTVDAVNVKFQNIEEIISNIESEVNEIQEIIITQLQPQYFNFNNQTTVICDHGLQKIPKVTVMIGTEEVFADIEHTPDMNTVIVTFSNNRTGVIIIQ